MSESDACRCTERRTVHVYTSHLLPGNPEGGEQDGESQVMMGRMLQLLQVSDYMYLKTSNFSAHLI